MEMGPERYTTSAIIATGCLNLMIKFIAQLFKGCLVALNL